MEVGDKGTRRSVSLVSVVLGDSVSTVSQGLECVGIADREGWLIYWSSRDGTMCIDPDSFVPFSVFAAFVAVEERESLLSPGLALGEVGYTLELYRGGHGVDCALSVALIYFCGNACTSLRTRPILIRTLAKHSREQRCLFGDIRAGRWCCVRDFWCIGPNLSQCPAVSDREKGKKTTRLLELASPAVPNLGRQSAVPE